MEKNMNAKEVQEQLLTLSHDLGQEDRRLAMLGEGNTSAAIGDGTFWVKASGSRLSTLKPTDLSRVVIEKALAVLDETGLDNAAVNQRLQTTLYDPDHKQPSVETFLHALCLTIGGAQWVGHTHTDSVLSILCSSVGATPFLQHIYPDEIVVCGRHIAVVPYVDPGLPLAVAVRDALQEYRDTHGVGPKVLLMVNHGPVALGQSAGEVLNIMLMLDKWARILIGTQAFGGPNYLSSEEADHLDNRPDEHYRRKQLAG